MNTAVAAFYNEMYAEDGSVRPAYREVAAWLQRNGLKSWKP
nr:hypothetical protein [Snodgrassella sp. CFCC 13594]